MIAAYNGEGFIKVIGEVGTGKTLLCRKLMSALDSSFYTAYIPNPYLEPRALMQALADELAIDGERDGDQHRLLKSINQRLLDLAGSGKKVLLCLDEAQALPLESLEALRLLTNLETEKRKLLQIVMFGQPELDEKLSQQSIRQLMQRITFDYRLEPLSKNDLTYYLLHRLHVAGYAGGPLFSPYALRWLHKASAGIPRLINILAHKSMLAAYGEGHHQIGTRHMKVAVADTASVKNKTRPWWPL